MSELPPGWAEAHLSELGSWSGGGTPSKRNPEYWTDGTIPWVSPKDMKVDVIRDAEDHITEEAVSASATKIVPSGSVLAVTRSGILRRTFPVAVASVPVAVNQDLKVLAPASGVNPHYVAWSLRNDERSILHECSKDGTTVDSIDFQALLRRTLPLPPTAEQERIVVALEEEFSRLAAGRAALDRARQNLRRMRAAVLHAAVTGRLSSREPSDGSGAELLQEVLERRSKLLAEHPYSGSRRSPKEPDAGALPPLPVGWVWATVDQLSTRVVDGVHRKPTYVPSGVPFVTVRNLTKGPGISFEELSYISEQDHEVFSRRTNPEYGDLLISKDGTLGVVRAIRDGRPFNIFVSVALIKPVLRTMTDYLEIALSSPVVQQQMVPKGSGLQHIHLEDLRADCIPLPPVAEQQRIRSEVARHLSLVEALEAALDAGAIRAGRLRSSILRAGLSGTLVPHDPRDEPASALLARIAAEHTTKAKKGRRRRAVA